jgi:hypothetical protein
MNRWVVALASFALACLGGITVAQDGRISDVSSGPVTFTVGDDDLVAAAACPGCTYVYPDPGPAIVFEVLRQNPNREYTVDAFHAGWDPASTLQLEARYTVTTRDGTRLFLETDWLPITEAPRLALVFTQAAVQRETWVRVTVAYRLALFGDEAAGEVATRVTHRVRETGSAVSHDVLTSLPTTLTLRLVGMSASATSFTVGFDYGDDVAAYLVAVTSGVPLTVTATDLARAEISTNHPRGYTVTVTIDEVLVPDGGAGVRDRVLLLGAPAHGRTFTSGGPTAGFVPLFDGLDYALAIGGDEPPGTYLLTVRLEATRNP